MTSSRKRPAREALAAKVAAINDMVVAGVIPEGTPELIKIDQVRCWEDLARGLATWTSFSVAAPGGPNADLRAELDELLPILARIRTGAPRAKGPRRGKPILQIQVERERTKLASQIEEVLVELDASRREIVRLRDLIAIKDNQIRSLSAALHKIKGLTGVPGRG